MDQFGKVIEVFLNAHQFVAFVWGPMKFLLVTASAYIDQFETLLDAYEKIGEQIPLLEQYKRLFSKDDQLKGALENMYVDILDFHESALQFFRDKADSGGLTRFFRSMWKNFDTKFQGILTNLARHKSFVENCVQVAQFQLYQEDVSDLRAVNASRFQQYQLDVVELKAKLDKAVAEEEAKKLKAVLQWLAAGEHSQQDHEAHQKIRQSYPSTTHWILENADVEQWVRADFPARSVMWLHGIPGAGALRFQPASMSVLLTRLGKTILASAIIDACDVVKDSSTAFFYCHDDDQASNSAVGILKGITQQLLTQNIHSLPACHTRYTSSGEPVLRSVSHTAKTLEDLCTILPKMYIIIDGLDECEPVERKQTIDCLMDIFCQCEKTNPGKLRLLFVSQNYADIKRGLSSPSRPATHIIQLSDKDNEGDINSYVRYWVGAIATKFSPFNDDMVQYLQRLTVHNAKGMFLYAKLVLQDLHAQPTREKVLEGIKDDNFPVGLKGAYERIRSMKNVASPPEWEKTKKLLGWMICAKRQLTWKEMQVALSIDVDGQSIEYDDRRFRRHIHDVCGSLVLLNGDRVSLVHSTAKTYITTVMDDIHTPSIECELAALCLRYLTFPCFDIDAIDDPLDLKEEILNGHLAFQDYAVAKWYHHVNAFISSGPKFMKESTSRDRYLEDMCIAVKDFMSQYSDANWSQGLVEACRTNCTSFEGLPVHNGLLLLTSHIYTVQKKGFDARHEVSIKSLAEALQRNRELLEKLPASKQFTKEDLARYSRYYDSERLFKCTKITCRYFSEGFKDSKARKKHVNIHERPFHCEVLDCLGAEGFTNHGDLQR
ncbi:hypothetical protein N0V91_003932 [Didymella pomorum]|uniref:C2H2-type domain-containing protein n=1 Tax=Didymella pomorum TaxID=749634 RepID=A0A9W8ZFK8_9PLEO|nr:hypothetical protein N0V91_003932 [Didymella pomorum]